MVIAFFLILLVPIAYGETVIKRPISLNNISLDDNLKLTWEKKSIQINPIIKFNGQEYDPKALAAITPGASYKNEIIKPENKYIKFSMQMNLSSLSVGSVNNFYLDFDFKGQKHYDTAIDRLVSNPINQTVKHREYYYRIRLDDGVVIDLNDLVKSGYTLHKFNDTRWVVGNLTANYKKGAILLDPTVITDCTSIPLNTTNEVYNFGIYDMEVDGTCLTVQANNITINCNNHLIGYALDVIPGYGILNDGFNGTKINNCSLSNNGNTMLDSSHGIYIINSNNISLFQIVADSNYINSNYAALIRTSYVNDLSINKTNITFYPYGDRNGMSSIYAEYGTNIFITDSHFKIEGGYYSYGIISSRTNNTLITNSQGLATGGVWNYLFIDSGSNYTTYRNDSADISYTSGGGFTVLGDSDHAYIAHDSLIDSCRVTASNSLPYYFYFWLTKAKMINSNSTVSGSTTLLDFNSAGEVEIINFTHNTGYVNFYPSWPWYSNISFLNSKVTPSMIQMSISEKSNATIFEFVKVNVTNGTLPLNATVNITDVLGTNLFYGMTGTNGITQELIAKTYFVNRTTKITYNNYTISANKTGYNSNLTYRNITGMTMINLSLVMIPNIYKRLYVDDFDYYDIFLRRAFRIRNSSTSELDLFKVDITQNETIINTKLRISIGLTQDIKVGNSSNNGFCYLNVTYGIITATTCK
jgi:hypothetical protein